MIRHAKSSWTEPYQNDHDRGLNGRGKRDAPRMAKYLQSYYPEIDEFISSTAKRAKKTSTIFHKIAFEKTSFREESRLYHASASTIIDVARGANNKHDYVAIFGHNPGMTDAVNIFNDGYIDNVPTCGIGIIEADITEWSELDAKNAKLKFFFYPKML